VSADATVTVGDEPPGPAGTGPTTAGEGTTAEGTTAADTAAAARTGRPVGRLARAPLRLVVSALAGALLYVSFPPRTLWWLAPVAFAALWWVVAGRRARAGFGYGLVFGLAFLVPLMHWTGVFVGPAPWLVLSLAEAVAIGGAGAVIALVSGLPGGPLWAGAAWVAVEAVRSRVPFGGMPWGRAGFGQPDGPLLPLAALGGVPLLSLATVLVGFGAADLARRAVAARRLPPQARPPRGARVRLLAAPALIALVPPVVALAGAPFLIGTDAQDGTVTAAVVQGNVPRAGLDFNAQRRAVLDNHAHRTEQLAADVAAGREPRPQVVIWPENSSDIDPLRNADAAAQIDAAASAIGVPIMVGAVLSHPGGPTNTLLVWDPVTGPGERHDKRRLQPFGEYMPWRGFFRHFSSYVDRAGNFQPGSGPGVLTMSGVPIGVATCWEVVFDDLVDDSVRNGAQVLAVPTNNATFGRTEMTYQQQAMSRVRAVEHSRAVLIAATSGVSAIIEPDGTVTRHTGLFEPGALVASVPRRDTVTLATRLGGWPDAAAGLAALVGLGLAVAARRRGTRGQSTT
jgi:apolipoprotein N-acyltransferase